MSIPRDYLLVQIVLNLRYFKTPSYHNAAKLTLLVPWCITQALPLPLALLHGEYLHHPYKDVNEI